MTGARLPYLGSRLQGFGSSIFSEMTKLAIQYEAVNLGQGFPDFDGPEFVKEAAIEAIRSGHNQYCRSFGIPELNAAIAEHQKRFWRLEYDPTTEITVTAGCTEAIFATLQAICEVGDEVILFEPFYDSYRASVSMVGAVERVVALRPPDFSFDAQALEQAFGPRTRAILVNTPHNPSGKVFTRDELEHIAELCKKHDVIAITDEVYEHLVFSGEHVSLATLPGMRERTVVLSSAGKSFSFTGWKIGHACAPAPLSTAIRTAHQFITFCNGSPFQPAIALAYRAPDTYFEQLRHEYSERRRVLCEGLADIGFGVIENAGTYFVQTDIRPLGYDDDLEFCRMLPEKVGVAAIPTSVFYDHRRDGRYLVRFAFCKTLPVIEAGLERLQKLKK